MAKKGAAGSTSCIDIYPIARHIELVDINGGTSGAAALNKGESWCVAEPNSNSWLKRCGEMQGYT
jgi:hypothetical protein